MSVPIKSDRFWLNIIYIVSGIIVAAVAFLILGPRPEGLEGSIDVSFLPTVNAIFNGITTILLVTGFILIKQKKIQIHKIFMLSAFGTSAAFLVSYVIYHWFKSGPKIYTGDFTTLYYFILLTHILLAAVIIPLALITLYRGWTSQLLKHRKIAKITFPLWMYVSVTGVLIYIMLY
ncbi:MAG: DUF420 domain-containing protein [Candidatus Marinimicrobia bacterium]|nr:DUF420 domain-containing protein [Candidatus Neomarinimicrobiota bacterium]